MDGITLSVIRCELGGYLPLRVQKVQQPAKKELVLTVWSPLVRERLVLSLEGQELFFGFSDEKKENPAVPPGFCLGLRKRLEGGTLVSIRQERLDRVLYLDFDGHDDFGNVKRYVLVFDMAGHEQKIGLYEDDLLVASIIPSDEGRFEHRSPYTPSGIGTAGYPRLHRRGWRGASLCPAPPKGRRGKPCAKRSGGRRRQGTGEGSPRCGRCIRN